MTLSTAQSTTSSYLQPLPQGHAAWRGETEKAGGGQHGSSSVLVPRRRLEVW